MTPLAQIDNLGLEEISYLYTDHLMTNRLATDAFQQVIWQWEGEAFGNTAAQELGAIKVNLRFPGQYFDTETNLHYNHFRYYDPSLGRYITSDPIGLAGGMNTFGYVEGNSLRYYDLLGLAKNKNKGKKPANPNKKPPPEHRIPGGERERNVGHPQGEEHSRRPKGGFRGRQGGFVSPSALLRGVGTIGLIMMPSPIACGELDCNGDGIIDYTGEPMLDLPSDNEDPSPDEDPSRDPCDKL